MADTKFPSPTLRQGRERIFSVDFELACFLVGYRHGVTQGMVTAVGIKLCFIPTIPLAAEGKITSC